MEAVETGGVSLRDTSFKQTSFLSTYYVLDSGDAAVNITRSLSFVYLKDFMI